jgi:hypothetical protein
MIRRYVKGGEAFQAAHGDRLHVVYYEDILAEPRAAADSLCRFLGIDFEPGMLATDRSNDTSAAIRSKRRTEGIYYTIEMFDRPIDASNTGKWRNELNAVDIRAIEADIGGRPLASLQRYQIGTAGWGWMKFFAIARPASSAASAVARRVRP